MKKAILIPGTLTTTRALRVFLACGDAEPRRQPLEQDYFQDFAIRDGTLPDHEGAMRRIKRLCRARHLHKGVLDRHGPVLRLGNCGPAVLAYQVVETTTIEDNRRRFGHRGKTETFATICELSKKVYVFGVQIDKAEARELSSWVSAQRRKSVDAREAAAFEERKVSVYFPDGARSFFRRKLPVGIKIGPATVVPFDPAKMEFRPVAA